MEGVAMMYYKVVIFGKLQSLPGPTSEPVLTG
jgi:hypothetical protein